MRRPGVLFALLMCAATPCAALDRTLDNGARVILIPHHANPMVASAVIVGAGVVDEPEEASGASHFLEHLLFNGTQKRTQRQLYDDVDRLGAYNNATTREDHTLFTFLVAREHAEAGLAIQADMLFHSTIPEGNFEKERKIVLEELARDRSDPAYDLEAAFRSTAFAGTPIARPVLGTEASLGAIERDQVVRYYKARYVPSNMTIVVMGDFEIEPMLALVKKTFGTEPGGKVPPPRAAKWPAAPKDNVEIAGSDKEDTRLLAAFPVEVAPADKTAAAAEVLLSAASDGKDSPLARALEARGIKAESEGLSLDRRRSPWTTAGLDLTLPKDADPASALDALSEAICATRAGGEARHRVPGVLARVASDAVLARDQIHYFALLRSSSILGAPSGAVESDAALTPDDLDQASSRLIAGLPSLRARLAGPGRTAGRISWTARACGAADPGPPVRAGALANGLRYVVRQSDDSAVFALHLAFVPRGASEPEGRAGLTDMLHRMIGKASIVHPAASLEDRLARLGARVKVVDDPSVPFDDYYTTSEFSWFRLEAPGSSWREAVSLLAEMIRYPSLTDKALSDARREMLERVARRDGSPRDTAMAALDDLLAPKHPVTTPVYGTRASVGAVTLPDVKSFHAASVVGRRAIVTVVSAAGADEVVRALEEDFGPLPPGDAVAAAPPVPVTDQGGTGEAKLGKSQAYLAMGRVLDVPETDKPALLVAVAMLSDRLAFDLRETKGLAYSIGASVRPWGGRTRIDVTMGTRAENVDKARAGIADGIKAFRDTPADPASVARAVNGARGAALMRRMTRISLAYEAGLEALRGAAPGSERAHLDAMMQVTADDVKRVTTAYLDPDRLAVAIVR